MRAVLLDLDDTLSDHAHSSTTALATVCAAVPALARLPFARVRETHAALLEELHLEMLRGERTLDSARVERFRRLLAAFSADADPALVAARYSEGYQAAYRPVPGALALLAALRGRAAVAVVTNNLQAEQEKKLRILGMTHLVDALVVSETVGVAKPDPTIFHHALHQLGADRAEAVMLGDSWSADVLGAHAAGIHAVWLNRHNTPCPDPSLAVELHSLESTDVVSSLLLGL
jgi:HAD superfamily hydrolase (TIGR01509 family)